VPPSLASFLIPKATSTLLCDPLGGKSVDKYEVFAQLCTVEATYMAMVVLLPQWLKTYLGLSKAQLSAPHL
jgi:hypothetical protein